MREQNMGHDGITYYTGTNENLELPHKVGDVVGIQLNTDTRYREVIVEGRIIEIRVISNYDSITSYTGNTNHIFRGWEIIYKLQWDLPDGSINVQELMFTDPEQLKGISVIRREGIKIEKEKELSKPVSIYRRKITIKKVKYEKEI